MSEVEVVNVWVSISGDYCAFHEMGFSVVYDITNDIQFDDMTLKELKAFKNDGDYCDYEKRKALKDGKNYYVKW
jgi:hypothetical protein